MGIHSLVNFILIYIFYIVKLGKSNLMDAISFVLGIKSAQLRSSQLKDLIYRGRAMQDDDEEVSDGMAIEGRTNNPKRAWVMAVYKDDNGNEIKFTRRYFIIHRMIVLYSKLIKYFSY